MTARINRSVRKPAPALDKYLAAGKTAAMHEPVPDEFARALAVSDRKAYFEQRIFVLSPFGTFATALIIFVLFAGTFLVAWVVCGRPFVSLAAGKLSIGILFWLGLWFSLMMATVLGMQRYARLKDREDIAQYAQVLRGGWESAARMTELSPQGIRLAPANIIGLAVGLAVSWFFYVTSAGQNLTAYPAMLVWMTTATTLLLMSFMRGVALTRSGGGGMRQTIDDELVIDLLRIDRLAVVGRSASRPSLIWFTISAAILLIFIGGGITPFTVSLLVACAAMGIWVFVATMEQVHRKIRAAKAIELERLRREIDALRARAAAETDASVRLQGLLAYEARIAAAPEWPFDQTTAVRVGASALILTVPWFGQAIAAYVVDHLSHIAG